MKPPWSDRFQKMYYQMVPKQSKFKTNFKKRTFLSKHFLKIIVQIQPLNFNDVSKNITQPYLPLGGHSTPKKRCLSFIFYLFISQLHSFPLLFFLILFTCLREKMIWPKLGGGSCFQVWFLLPVVLPRGFGKILSLAIQGLLCLCGSIMAGFKYFHVSSFSVCLFGE